MTMTEIALLAVATCLYAAQAVAVGVRFFRAGRAGSVATWSLPLVAVFSHTAFLISRAAHAGGLPIETRLDSFALFLWITAVVYLVSLRPYRLQTIAPVFWPVYAACAVAMSVFAGRSPADRPDLERMWLFLHLIPVYAGYAGFAVATGMGLAYLLQQRLLRRKSSDALWLKLPSLEMLDRVGRSAVSAGFPLLTLGLVLGAVWAEQQSARLGRAWYADPKVVSGTVVWLTYAAVLHVRLFAKVTAKRAAVLTIAGFVVTLATFAAAHAYPSQPSSSRSLPQMGARFSSARASWWGVLRAPLSKT